MSLFDSLPPPIFSEDNAPERLALLLLVELVFDDMVQLADKLGLGLIRIVVWLAVIY